MTCSYISSDGLFLWLTQAVRTYFNALWTKSSVVQYLLQTLSFHTTQRNSVCVRDRYD